MKNLPSYLKLIVDNPKPVKQVDCQHTSISLFSESETGDASSYVCDHCKAKFKNYQVGIFQDAFGYAGYHAITD